jgi:thioredoxin 2
MNQIASKIIPCTQCGAKNKIPLNKMGVAAKCGKCQSPLQTEASEPDAAAMFTIRCTACRTKNRIPATKINEGAKCGKCHESLKTQELFIKQPVVIADNDFDDKVLKSPLPVLVDCWAPWCGVCRMTMPVIDELAAEWIGKIRVCRLNVDSNPLVASKFQIRSTPTALIFDNGRLVDTLVGAVPKHQIVQKMSTYL